MVQMWEDVPGEQRENTSLGDGPFPGYKGGNMSLGYKGRILPWEIVPFQGT